MNQILYTGGKNKKGQMTDSQKIVIFFVVFIIIFAICIIVLGANLLTKVKNENVANLNGTNNIGGTNNTGGTTATEEYINITFSAETNGVKIQAESLTDAKIKTVSYWWEGEEKVTNDVLDTQYETVVTSKYGSHYLYVEAIDENENKKEVKKQVIGKTEEPEEPEEPQGTKPDVEILTDGVSNYVVRVKDDEEITKIVVTLKGETEEIEVNSKEYEYRTAIPQGSSIIEVTAYNINGLSTTKKAQVRNFGE